MDEHIGKMKELRARLISLGETISDDLFQVVLIHSLPSEGYSDLLRTWEMTHASLKTTEFLISCLHRREAEKPQEEMQAMFMRLPREE